MTDRNRASGRLLVIGALALMLAVLAGCLFYRPLPPWVSPPRAEASGR